MLCFNVTILFLVLCGGLHELSVCRHTAPSYLSVYYTHCPGAARMSFILCRSPPR